MKIQGSQSGSVNTASTKSASTSTSQEMDNLFLDIMAAVLPEANEIKAAVSSENEEQQQEKPQQDEAVFIDAFAIKLNPMLLQEEAIVIQKEDVQISTELTEQVNTEINKNTKLKNTDAYQLTNLTEKSDLIYKPDESRKVDNQTPLVTVDEKLNKEITNKKDMELASSMMMEKLNAIPSANVEQATGADLIMKFKSEKGVVPKLNNNAPVNALIELGNIAVMQSGNNKAQPAVSTLLPQIKTVDPVKQPEYELTIQLQPEVVGSLKQEVYNANIKIHPPELGAIVAKLKVDKNSAELIMTTENNQLKEIVQANIAQLRENFRQADIHLSNIVINVQTPQSNANTDQHAQRQSQEVAREDEEVKQAKKANTAPGTQAIDSLIDTYA